jgi:hypothetical protein
MPRETLEKKDVKYFGIYRGKVLDNVDPDKLGRVKVQIYPAFAEIIDPAGLPWAVPATPISQGAGQFDPNDITKEGIGTFIVPRINTYIFCFFEEGDPYQPVYFAEATTAKWGIPIDRRTNVLKTIKDTVDEPSVPIALDGTWVEGYDTEEPNYPHNKVIKTISGIVVEVEDKVEDPQKIKVKIFHPSKSWLEWHTDGTLNLHLAGNEQIVVKGGKNEYVKGTFNLTVNGNLNAKVGQNLNVEVGQIINVVTGGAITVTAGGVVIIQGPLVHINP